MEYSLTQSLSLIPTNWKAQGRIYGEACEFWIEEHLPCPSCGGKLVKLTANEKSIDHTCSSCSANWQAKASKNKLLRRDGSIKITGAEYQTTLSRVGEWGIIAIQYCKDENKVLDIRTVSANKITEDCIIPRKPLSQNARRAGWQGCYILLEGVGA